MQTSDQSVVLVFNGEIYNQQQLRRELEAAGYNFRSHSDTEVLLHGFRHWGQKLWQRLEGIFAVACWEPCDRRLTLARDRFGVKPLLWQREPPTPGLWLRTQRLDRERLLQERGHQPPSHRELSALGFCGCTQHDH